MRVCSLFCGIGGIDLAFVKAGHEIVWANDIDKYACMTYRHNFPDTPLVEGDIRSIDKKDIPDFDILTAGFPCQPFSVCGKQKGFSDERGNLFFEIGKVIDEKHPSVVFLENVANLTEHDKGKTFNVIHNELAGRGYFIRYLIADACDYGVPQHRTRTYIVAFTDRNDCERFTFPEKVPLEKHITDVIDVSVKVDDAVLAIVLPDRNGSYKYFLETNNCCETSCRTLKTDTLFTILKKNMFNIRNPDKSRCNNNSEIYHGDSSYICSVKWEDFIKKPNEYIEKAYRLQNSIEQYDIYKEVD